MVREWRYLKMLKRSGCTRVKDGNIPTSFAIFCPACLQPGINLPEGWENAPDETRLVSFSNYVQLWDWLTLTTICGNWLYTQILALNANFWWVGRQYQARGRTHCLQMGMVILLTMQHLKHIWKPTRVNDKRFIFIIKELINFNADKNITLAEWMCLTWCCQQRWHKEHTGTCSYRNWNCGLRTTWYETSQWSGWSTSRWMVSCSLHSVWLD